MKRFTFLLLSFLFTNSFSQIQIHGAMKDYFANPVVEEGKRNIILQNRCGNRLTLMVFDDRTDLEFTYKPNAFRRKEYRARNFSSRDNVTLLFPSVKFPMVNVKNIAEYGYDPFNTKIKVNNNGDAKNEISIINVADENMFAIAARSPLLLAIKPHVNFVVKNGLLTEKFSDRGEEIISYISFENLEQNRLRVLSDGTYIIQLFENEVVLFGGEENDYQVNRAVERFRGKNRDELVAINEALLARKMNQGVIKFNQPDFQKVLDINHRVVFSGIDEGGACFGALNRIYYLIWVRDGSMTSSLMARAGNPELIKIWAPFLLNNPSITRREDGTRIPEFLQIVGSRWTRSEDDGIFYATLSLYSYFNTTGQDDLLQGKELPLLIEAIDRYLEKTWKDDKKLMISNTIGETPLRSDPYFGYDVVTGNYEHNDFHMSQGKELYLNASLYNQVNTYNILMMASELLAQRSSIDMGHSKHYMKIADDIKNSVKTKFYDKVNDCLYSSIEFYTDKTEGALSFKVDNNPWEGSWACAIGPFFPAPDLQLKTARVIYETWPKITKQGYGYCPWNTISKVLYEYGLSSNEYEQMLSAQIKDAMAITEKYPMQGGLTEYNTNPNSWRALPFSAGSLFFSMGAQMISSLPNGVAVRASNKVDSILNFRCKLSTINASASGKGDAVISYILNDDSIPASLQIPDDRLMPGQNTLKVVRGSKNNQFRLFSSSAQLLKVSHEQNVIIYSFRSTVPSQIYFENFNQAKEIDIISAKNGNLKFSQSPMSKTNITLIETEPDGLFKVKIAL